MDQEYTLAVSLKELAKSQWEAGRSAGEWTFELPHELFPGQAHVRLRGLGLAVVGEQPPAVEPEPPKPKAGQKAEPPPPKPKPLGFWSARLSAPAQGSVRHLAGAAKDLDQKAVATCFLGRVCDRDSAREPEIGGAEALHNASPIGKQWKLNLSAKSTDGIQTTTLQDVQIYLRVAVRSLKAGG
jgi:hypothetical protein